MEKTTLQLGMLLSSYNLTSVFLGTMLSDITVVLPAKNESASLPVLLPRIKEVLPKAEILVVDDGSDDGTGDIALSLGAQVIRNPYSMGNGAAIKAGARAAKGRLLVFMDADGQHDPQDIPRLLEKFKHGYKMVVGARKTATHASWWRRWANHFYSRLATIMTGYRIEDLTSGFRVVDAESFRKFLYLLPNGFSYPTTSTMAFFRAGFPVSYVPISARNRQDSTSSHIRLFRDGIRFFIIILKIGTLFSPMRLFLPVSLVLMLIGVGYYGYTYLVLHRFTNMSALLLMSSLLTFLIGILSEQVSALHYRGTEDP